MDAWGKGIRFAPMYSRQAFKHDGKFVFWGGLAFEAWGGGPGLVEGLYNSADRHGIKVAYEARGEKLIADDDGVHGVIANVEGKTTEIKAKAVVLACGGFEANAEMRTRYLGPGWDLAKVRGNQTTPAAGSSMALADRRDAVWLLVGLSRGRLGLRGARIRRRCGR